MPDGNQQRDMRRFAGSCRFVFHKALALQKANHEAGYKFIRYVEMANQLPAWKSEFAWLKESPSQALQHALKNLDRAFCVLRSMWAGDSIGCGPLIPL